MPVDVTSATCACLDTWKALQRPRSLLLHCADRHGSTFDHCVYSVHGEWRI